MTFKVISDNLDHCRPTPATTEFRVLIRTLDVFEENVCKSLTLTYVWKKSIDELGLNLNSA